MQRIEIIDGNDRAYIDVPIKDLSKFETYNQLVEDFGGSIDTFPIYYDIVIAEEFFLDFLKRYQKDPKYVFDFFQGIYFINIINYLNNEQLIEDISLDLAKYLMSDDLINILQKDDILMDDVCFHLSQTPNEIKQKIVKHIDMNADYLFNKYPKKRWNVSYLSDKISEETLLKYPKEDLNTGYFNILRTDSMWNWYDLSTNSNISMKFIEEHINWPWYFGGIAKNPNVTPEFIEKYYLKFEETFEFSALSEHKNITYTFIEKHPEWRWRMNLFREYSPNVTEEYIINNVDFNNRYDWEELSKNIYTVLNLYDKHPEWPWDWDSIRRIPDYWLGPNKYMGYVELLEKFRPDMRDFVNRHLDKWNNDKYIAQYGTLDMINEYIVIKRLGHNNKFIREYRTLLEWNENLPSTSFYNNYNIKWTWGITGLSKNSGLTPDFIEQHIDKPWNWTALSSNPNLTIDFIRTYKDRWNWNKLSSNEAITMDIIKNNSDLPWVFKGNGISSNPNISALFVIRHNKAKWSYGKIGLSTNNFKGGKYDALEDYLYDVNPNHNCYN